MRREKVLWLNAKNRAKARGLRFEIAIEDVVFPDRCPILDIPLVLNRGCAGPNSPSIDRIIPDLGYVPGNVQIISHKANTMKSNASIEELRALLAFMERTCPPQEVSA